MSKRVGLTAGFALSLALVAPVLAAQPANRACLGDTLRAAAQTDGFGELVSSVAMDIRGVGEEVQLILAGEFPDEAFANTCND